MPATYTKEVILTGDANPQGDSYTINNLDNVSWVTTSTNNAGVNPVISFTIADWAGSQGSTRTANFAIRHWLYNAGDPEAIHEATFQIIQHAENQVTVTTTQATAATTQATAATTQATAATTQATAATTTDSGSGGGAGAYDFTVTLNLNVDNTQFTENGSTTQLVQTIQNLEPGEDTSRTVLINADSGYFFSNNMALNDDSSAITGLTVTSGENTRQIGFTVTMPENATGDQTGGILITGDTEEIAIQVTVGNGVVHPVTGISANLPLVVTPTSSALNQTWAGPGTSLTGLAQMTWVTDATGQAEGGIPTWITNVSASTDALGVGFLSYTVEDQTNLPTSLESNNR